MERVTSSKIFLVSLIIVIIVVLFFTLVSNKEKKILNNNVSSVETKILGNEKDLVSFSVNPGQSVTGILNVTGVVRGGYFFEGNILLNILDSDKKILRESNGKAKTEWMTAVPVTFEGELVFTMLPRGRAFIEIHNDNASGLPENDKSILIPIIIE